MFLKILLHWRYCLLLPLLSVLLLVVACTTLPPTIPTATPPPTSLQGWRHIADIAKNCGAVPKQWHVTRHGGHFATPHATLRLFPESRRLEINDRVIWLNAPLTAYPPHSANFYMAPADAADIIALHRPPAPRLPHNAGRRFLTVMLDPGHGGDDCGAISTITQCHEKELTLDLARRVASLLTRAPVQVVFSRNTDFTLPLDLRPQMAANNRVDCFVSIHANTAANSNAEGVESYVATAANFPSTSGGAAAPISLGNRHNGTNFVLAYAIHDRLVALGCPDRGLKRARYHVLQNAPCPAVLLEVGFLSHHKEARQLNSGSYRQKLAEAIAAGITDYATQKQLTK